MYPSGLVWFRATDQALFGSALHLPGLDQFRAGSTRFYDVCFNQVCLAQSCIHQDCFFSPGLAWFRDKSTKFQQHPLGVWFGL
jgi:hypothetical protein